MTNNQNQHTNDVMAKESPDNDQIAVEVKHLKKSFKKNDVLKDINLELKKLENFVILGKSGIGKSVLTKCIVRLIEPDSGTIRVMGKDIISMDYAELNDARAEIGYLFQGGALYDSMTVRDNLAFPVRRRLIGKNPREVQQLVMEALEYVGLTEAVNKMPSELSGGMKKRIGLARTLILKPKVILYDEPTTGLDPVTSGEISELILEIREKTKTSSIIITHDMKCAKITSDRMCVLQDGQLNSVGTYNELENSDDPDIRAYFH